MRALILSLFLLAAVTCQAQPRVKISAEPRTNAVHLADLLLWDIYLANGDGTHSTNWITRGSYATNLLTLIFGQFTAGWGIGQSTAANVLTTSQSNQVTLIASNSTTAQADFTTTPDYRSTDIMRANLTLQLTNLVPGRAIAVYLTGDTNGTDRTVTVVTNGIPGGVRIRWGLGMTNGATSYTVTNGMADELQLKCLSATEVRALHGPEL